MSYPRGRERCGAGGKVNIWKQGREDGLIVTGLCCQCLSFTRIIHRLTVITQRPYLTANAHTVCVMYVTTFNNGFKLFFGVWRLNVSLANSFSLVVGVTRTEKTRGNTHKYIQQNIKPLL